MSESRDTFLTIALLLAFLISFFYGLEQIRAILVPQFILLLFSYSYLSYAFNTDIATMRCQNHDQI